MWLQWGRFIHRFRWSVLGASALLLVLSLAAVLRGGSLTTGTITGTEAARGLSVIEHELPRAGGPSFTVVFRGDGLESSDPSFREAMLAALAPLRGDPRIASVKTPYDDEPAPLTATRISSDGRMALAVVTLTGDVKVASSHYPEIAERVRSGAGPLETVFTGRLAFKHDLDRTLEADLRRAELYSIPLALLVLLLAFRSLVAASLPLGSGALTVLGGMAAVYLLSGVSDVAQYSLNIVSLVGLGVAIDYSLFIVSRFREELVRRRTVADAVAHTMATAGRSVVFSGVAVAIGLTGLFFFRGSYLSSIGVAGSIVVALAVLYAVTFLPALLSVLGPRVDRGRVLPRRTAGRGRFWHGVATWVMRRPLWVLLPTLAAMLTIGVPFLDLVTASADVRVLPPAAEARRGHAMLMEQFPAQAATRIVVVARFPDGSVLRPDRYQALEERRRAMATIPGVLRVQSALDIVEMAGGLEAIAEGELTPSLQALFSESVGERVALIAVLTSHAPASPEARAILSAIRTQPRVADGELLVTGQTALDADGMAFVRERAPLAVGFVMAMTMLVLFLLLGSVVLPIKAVLMNLLSITGSFGALVWIFQEGHLSGVLGFTPGPIDPALPVILFSTVFGLSMDYEVLLLSRVQEEYRRTGDNTHAVAEGLERSGGLITSAAAIMVAVFAAFATADVVLIKAIGIGMAIAVALDATVVRLLIVPATMRLFGDLNWWAPAPLARLQRRLGTIEPDDVGEPDAPSEGAAGAQHP
jgi:putative drug exporter of the RND superfamily